MPSNATLALGLSSIGLQGPIHLLHLYLESSFKLSFITLKVFCINSGIQFKRLSYFQLFYNTYQKNISHNLYVSVGFSTYFGFSISQVHSNSFGI